MLLTPTEEIHDIQSGPQSRDLNIPLLPTEAIEPHRAPSIPTSRRKLSDDAFLATFGEPKGPTPRVLRPRPKSGSSVLRARASTTAKILAARLKRLTLAARKTPRTRLNPTVRQGRALDDWTQWLDAI